MSTNMKKFLRRGNAGFSLVELMVVVAIIGILAALAVPKFQTFQAKAKQSEAKGNLSQIYTLEQTYSGQNDTFATATTPALLKSELGYTTSGKVRYNYSVTGATASVFTGNAIATGIAVIKSDCAFSDTWTIDQDKNLGTAPATDCTAN